MVTLSSTLLVFLIIVLSVVSIGGFIYTPSAPKTSTITAGHWSTTQPVCSEKATKCVTDADCSKCEDKDVFDITCKKLSSGKKYCLPRKPTKPCNQKLGGVWTWSGWADTNTKEWECMCTLPEIAGNIGCTKLNPNVCKGGKYNYSAIGSKRGPLPSDCICPENTFQIVTENNVPMCIPKSEGICPDIHTCTMFYSSL